MTNTDDFHQMMRQNLADSARSAARSDQRYLKDYEDEYNQASVRWNDIGHLQTLLRTVQAIVTSAVLGPDATPTAAALTLGRITGECSEVLREVSLIMEYEQRRDFVVSTTIEFGDPQDG